MIVLKTTIKGDRQTDYFCALHQLPDDFATKKRHLVRVNRCFFSITFLQNSLNRFNLQNTV